MLKLFEKKDSRCQPALHVAVRQGCQPEDVQAILEGTGTDIDAVDSEKGVTALHIAAGNANLPLVRLLLSKDASVSMVDRVYGETALHTLARKAAAERTACEVAKCLLDHGASPLAKRGKDDRRPAQLFKNSRELRDLLAEAEAEWERRARSWSDVAKIRRALEAGATKGMEERIVDSMPTMLYQSMRPSNTSWPHFVSHLLNLQAEHQYSVFSRAFLYEERVGSLRQEIAIILRVQSNQLQDYLPEAASRSIGFDGGQGDGTGQPGTGAVVPRSVPSGMNMLLNIIREALSQGNQKHLSYLQGLILAEEGGKQAIFVSLLPEALNRKEKQVLGWFRSQGFDEFLLFPKDHHLVIIKELGSRRAKRSFYRHYVNRARRGELLEIQARQGDKEFFESFIIESDLYAKVLGPREEYRSFWASECSEFFLNLLQPEHWLVLLNKHAADGHNRWLCEMGALHRCIPFNRPFSIDEELLVKLRAELASSYWHGMTLLEFACFKKNKMVVKELHKFDSRLLTDSEALTLTTDFEMLLLVSSLWKDVEWKAAHDLARSRAPEEAILDACKAMIHSEEHLQLKEKVNPVSLAVQYWRNLVLDYYLQINPELASKGEPSPLWYATVTGNEAAVRSLLNKLTPEDVARPAPDCTTPMLVATVKGFGNILQMFKEKAPGLFTEGEGPLQLALGDDGGGATSLRAGSCELGDEADSSISDICQLTRDFPMHVESTAGKQWTPKYKDESEIAVAEVQSNHLLNVCGLEPQSSPEKMYASILQCQRRHNKNSFSACACPAIRDLAHFLVLLKEQLKRNNPELKALGFTLDVIGSIREGSRLGSGIEMDANILFKRLMAYPFVKSATCYSLQLSTEGYTFFKAQGLLEFVCKRGDQHELNTLAFMRYLLRALREAIYSMKLPTDLFVREYNPECEECKAVSRRKATEAVQYHCEGCLPVVAMTKLGPCIQLEYRGQSEPQVCTIDLIPLFPHTERPLELIRQVVLTPYEERRPGWSKAVMDYIDRDRFIFEEDQDPSSQEAALLGCREGKDCPPKKNATLIALKLQHFGARDIYMIRGTQDVNSKLLKTDPKLLEVYIALKVARDVLSVDCNSYMLKKTLLKDAMIAYLQKAPTSLQLFYEALIQPELKPIFQEHIDLNKTQQRMEDQRTDIVIYRNLGGNQIH